MSLLMQEVENALRASTALAEQRLVRVAELEAALREWRDDYEHTKRHDGDAWVAVPIHQITALLGEPK